MTAWTSSVILCVWLGAAQLLLAEMDLPKLAAQTKSSVGLVEVYDSSKTEIATGSGFFVGANQFVTNCHVVDGATSVKVKMEGGEEWDAIGVQAVDAKKDIAILFINCKAATPLALSKIAAIDPGTHIAVIGSPLGLEGTVSDGIVSSVRLTSSGTILQITAPISHGSSGSPVINEKGEVIGVAYMNIEGGQALNFAISSATVLGMLSTITDKTPFGKYPNVEADQSTQLNHDPDYQKAMALMDQGNYDDALQILKKLVVEYPKAGEIYFQLGYIFDRAKLWTEAIEAYNRATQLSPDQSGIWEEFGKTLTRAGKPDDAVIAVKRGLALKYAANRASLWDALGCAYGNKGDRRNEIAAFDQAVRLAPSSRLYGLLASAYASLGQQQGDAQQYADAIQSYKNANTVWQIARKTYPQWPQPVLGTAENYTGMALILQKQGNAPVGDGLIQMALNIAPVDVMVLWNSSTFYYKSGRADRYQATLTSLNAINPLMASQLDSSLRSH